MMQWRASAQNFGRVMALTLPLPKCVSKKSSEERFFSDEQSATPKEVVTNTVYLSELVDSLYIQFKAFDEWSYGKDSALVRMRRQLNGTYRVFMHEDK